MNMKAATAIRLMGQRQKFTVFMPILASVNTVATWTRKQIIRELRKKKCLIRRPGGDSAKMGVTFAFTPNGQPPWFFVQTKPDLPTT